MSSQGSTLELRCVSRRSRTATPDTAADSRFEMPPTTPVPPTPPNSPVLPGPPRSSVMSNAPALYRDRYVRIVNNVTHKGLLAGSWGTKADDPNVWQYPLTNIGPNAHGFEWILFPTSDGSYLIV